MTIWYVLMLCNLSPRPTRSQVREAFHMETFVSMLAYDPKVAKEDRSAVFQEYKAKYDLLEKSAAAGPSRSTRSAHNARLGALKATPIPAATKPKRPTKPSKQDNEGGTFWTIYSAAKSRDKGKARGDPGQEDITHQPDLDSDTTLIAMPASISAVKIQGSKHLRKRPVIEISPSPHGLGEPPPNKKRKLAPSISAPNLPPRTRSSYEKPEPAPPVSPYKSTSIRRIKLIVRRPVPTLTHPSQKAPPPKHGQSLTTFLQSYSTLDDQDVDTSVLEERAKERARFLNKIASMRKQGRLLYTFEGERQEPKRVGGDIWDHLLEDVKARARVRPTSPRQGALQVANRVKAYWESQAAKEDKVKALEEKRLRALAKSTVKLVINKWKEAVLHIREEERQKVLEEERRRGHEHLDDILNRSGRILEAQQAELSKNELVSFSRSRSSSLAGTAFPWTVSPDASDDESGDTEDDEPHRANGLDSDDEDLDTAGLLGSVRSHSVTSGADELDSSKVESSRSSLVLVESGAHSSRSETPVDGLSQLLVDYEVATPSPIPSRDSSSLLHPDVPIDSVVATPDAAFEDTVLSRAMTPSEDGAVSYHKPGVDSSLPPLSIDHAASTTDEAPLAQSPKVNGIVVDGPVVEQEEEGMVLDEVEEEENDLAASIPAYLRPYAVAPVEWDPQQKVTPPLLLRGTLRPYQQVGLEWLANIHVNNLNGILADEMGLGKTIQTIALLAHLACDRGIWGPHLIIVPTSVLLNWEMEFKKFLPGFKILSYHGNTKRRKELRQGWNNKYHFNVCVTSYTLASRDAHVFKRKPWYYMILDEAHMIKNFKSQRWNTLLMFRSFRRLLLTGTPLQNNLTELWALLQFLMSGTNFANLKEFADWFSNPLEKAIEMGTTLDDENQQRVAKLHTVLRPYLLRRLKRDVEKELPSKFEHIVMCPLSKRQRFLYDEFMARAETRHDLQSGVYQKIANILMQLRKVVNHPDLFEVRPIRTSFAMDRSAIADFEIKELLVRRQLLQQTPEDCVNLDVLGLQFIGRQNTSLVAAMETHRLDATRHLPYASELLGEAPPYDTRTISGFRKMREFQQRAARIARWDQIGYLNHLRCSQMPLISEELIALASQCRKQILPIDVVDPRRDYMNIAESVHKAVKSYSTRAEEMGDIIDKFAFATPPVVARDLARLALGGNEPLVLEKAADSGFDQVLHRSAVKLQIAFPDPSLLQYDCGKLQQLADLLRERKMGGHRVLIFTQMTRILDILEIFLNFHGYLYLRLDGATKIEDRQYITERFNVDSRVFCFISSSRSGGIGINLTGADTVIFYDSDFNPQMDRQCEDRAHRIGQIRDVHIYRFISEHTVEEALLRKANQKRSLDNIVIQQGEFDWRSLMKDEGALTRALGEFEDAEDARAAAVAAREEVAIVGADEADFGWEGGAQSVTLDEKSPAVEVERGVIETPTPIDQTDLEPNAEEEEEEEEEEEGGTTVEYMLSFVRSDMEFFAEWRI
ncbi:unnamed protein product [Somion occarium]|uniref:Helicase SWR1 n=1 Tax=Somion occarium TaxID=3059160 RepID=A0ABP1DWG4_9APHY